MKLSILTLFPEMFDGPFQKSIVGRAVRNNSVQIDLINIRNFAHDRYKSVDGHPYGGGVGMILRVDVIDRAIQSIKTPKSWVILLDAAGPVYTQKKARELSKLEHLILICGHYEGVDDRVRTLINEELSVGEYVLTGGEIPAMVITDSVVRLLPGVLSKKEAILHESFTENLVEYPQFTQPRQYNGTDVPDVLLSGNHANISRWKNQQSAEKTKKRVSG